MADIDFKAYLIMFAVASLFVFSLFSFGTQLIENTNSSAQLVDTDLLNMTGIQENLNYTNAYTQTLTESFNSDAPDYITGVLALGAIWGIITNTIGLVFSSSLMFIDIMVRTLGIPGIALGVVLTIILLGIVFAGWKLLKLGE